MTEHELNEIERLAVDQDRLFDPCVVIALLAEVRRLRCCGNCRQQVGNPYFECAYMDIESYNESGCKRCSEWEAAGNG